MAAEHWEFPAGSKTWGSKNSGYHQILGKSSAKAQNFFYKKSFTYCQI